MAEAPVAEHIVKFFKAQGIDITKEGTLEVLLRPHVTELWAVRGGEGFGNPIMNKVLKDIIEKLDYPEIPHGTAHIYYTHSAWQSQASESILSSFLAHLKEIVRNLGISTTRTQRAEAKAAHLAATKEAQDYHARTGLYPTSSYKPKSREPVLSLIHI